VFTVGAFARIAGVSPKMLRSYDALGLFRPAWRDSHTGYRCYSPAQLPELRRILGLRDVGVGLREIHRLVAGGADLGDALARRRAELESERAEIDRRLAALEIAVEEDARDGIEGIGAVVVRRTEVELVAVRSVGEAEDDAAAFHDLEAHVRDAGRRARQPPSALMGDDGAWEVVVPITRSVATTDRISVRRLPAGRAATVLVRGGYDRLVPAIDGLDRWIAAAGLRRAGPLRILYLQFGAERELRVPTDYVVDRPEEYVTELRRPVADAALVSAPGADRRSLPTPPPPRGAASR
jgi:DNA-binding transcriptional MerR regulator/effector-binding domain-containing protein